MSLLQKYRICPYPRVIAIMYRELRVIFFEHMLFVYSVALRFEFFKYRSESLLSFFHSCTYHFGFIWICQIDYYCSYWFLLCSVDLNIYEGSWPTRRVIDRHLSVSFFSTRWTRLGFLKRPACRSFNWATISSTALVTTLMPPCR